MTGNTQERKPKPRVSIIVAMARNRVIGRDGQLPWHIPEDLKRFKQLTMGHHIVMGRKTWDSLGRLLPGRRHVIVSRQPDYRVPGAQIVRSLDTAIAACAGDEEIFIIGGGEIYRQALTLTDRIYLTQVALDAEGDTAFPELQPQNWKEAAREHKVDPASGIEYVFLTLQRNRDNLVPRTAPGRCRWPDHDVE